MTTRDKPLRLVPTEDTATLRGQIRMLERKLALCRAHSADQAGAIVELQAQVAALVGSVELPPEPWIVRAVDIARWRGRGENDE
jgi:hypothetical protein